ncbi:MAG: CHAT domain-containing protein [Candidatus Thiodiazotropha endolucinida]
MATKAKTRKLNISGHKTDDSQQQGVIEHAFSDMLKVKVRKASSVNLAPNRSGDSETITLTPADGDVIQLNLEGDIQLYTSVARLCDEILPQGRKRSAGTADVELPRRLTIANQRSRGEDGLSIEGLQLLDIEGALIDHVTGKAAPFTARKLAEWMEGKLIGDGGLVCLKYEESNIDEPVMIEPANMDDFDLSREILLFLHGTGSSVEGSFSELWKQGDDDLWGQLSEHYKDNLFALQHRTLTESPIDNAVQVMEALPNGARLHIVSHSRGGLVGELLCRGQLSGKREPFSKEEIDLFTTHHLMGLADALQVEVETDYKRHRDQLRRLNSLLIEKHPWIERFVRVGCPARGTTLASGKLDIYLSGLLNVIGYIPILKASRIYDFFKAFTLAVAKERTRPETLPGLEAQMPGSPLIALLNATPVSSEAPLSVIEGDIEPTGIFKKIAIFFLDQFYESEHDLVVNTPSMDGGARRVQQIPVLPERGKEVNHFNYFSNKRSREGLLAALIGTQTPPSSFVLREQVPSVIARSLPRDKKSGDVPVVFVLPGISGSHLAKQGNRIWVDPFDLMRGRFKRLKRGGRNITPDGLVAGTYAKLVDFLSQTHEVIPHSYDWRLSVIKNGELLAAEVDKQLSQTTQPVRIVAHSMGGLVFRGMAAYQRGAVWDRMRGREGSRVLMLGTPNRGSYSIPRILAGQDRLIRVLAAADLKHNQNELLEYISQFKGILELLPVDDNHKLPNVEIWEKYQKVLGDDWIPPDPEYLKDAQDTWAKLKDVGLDSSHVCYIAGHANATPVDHEVDEGGSRVRILSTRLGDGQVTWKTGIPDGIKHWYVDAVHGDIPDHQPAFNAMLEILETGETRQLSTKPPVSRSIEKEYREMLPDAVDFYPSEAHIQAATMGRRFETHRPKAVLERKPRIRIVHGNLCFAKSPIVVGHYQGDTIVSAEKALDSRLNGRLSKRLQLGLYPGPLRSHEVLLNIGDHRFPGALIIGLGEVGSLTPGGLTETFREAVLRYVVNRTERGDIKEKGIELSSLLIGTGAGGMAPEDAIMAILRAVLEANRLLAGSAGNLDNTVVSLTFIELYEDTAVDAVHTLCQIAEKNPEFKNRIEIERELQNGDGGRTRVYYREDPEWWQRLRIKGTKEGALKFTALTARGTRAEMITQPIQRQSVMPFLNAATTYTSSDTSIGRTLFELLIPAEFKVHARHNQDLVLLVDERSAGYPWELLEYAGQDGNEPLAHKSGMIRQLVSSKQVRTKICDNHKALVIGDPKVNDKRFVALSGAVEEAEVVHRLLKDHGYGNSGTPMTNSTGSEILAALMTDEYQILHLAAHGVVDFKLKVGDKTSRVTGMVIGKDQVLSPIELRQMPATPAFVFINCCHLGSSRSDFIKNRYRRHELASNLATQLIRQGVRAVIAAGWAVDDDAAVTFAKKFYQEFLTGTSFGDAVKMARLQAYEDHPGINTWGAYQCYGDPGYTLATNSKSHSGGTDDDKCKYVSLAEYRTEISNITERAKTASDSDIRGLQDWVQSLSKEIPDKWRHNSQLQEALGRAWGELDCFDKAIEAYELALSGDPAYASLRCAEQLSNFEARYAVELHVRAEKSSTLSVGEKRKHQSRSRRLIRQSETRINRLNTNFNETVERLALKGGMYKRRAILECDNKAKLKKTLALMGDCYKSSYEKKLKGQGEIYPYPLINWLTVRWLLKKVNNTRRTRGDDFDALLTELQAKVKLEETALDQERFWDAIAENDCNVLHAIRHNQLKSRTEEICKRYQEIREVAASPRQFRSVEEHLDFLWKVSDSLGLKPIAECIKLLFDTLKVNSS